MEKIVVDVIQVSAHVNGKINQKHGVNALDVEDAVANRNGVVLAPNQDGVVRALITGRTEKGVELAVVLFPTDMLGVWNLATAFPRQ